MAYETAYFSTVYQPRDDGAGLIHMIPANWKLNARDMDLIWPGNDYEEIVNMIGEKFFQNPEYGNVFLKTRLNFFSKSRRICFVNFPKW